MDGRTSREFSAQSAAAVAVNKMTYKGRATWPAFVWQSNSLSSDGSIFHASSAKTATRLWRAGRMPKTLSKQIFLLWRAVKNKNKYMGFFCCWDLFTTLLEVLRHLAGLRFWSSESWIFSFLLPFFFQQSWCADFHNAMLIYVQTIASNFSRAVSPLCRAPLWIIVGNEYSCRRDYKPGPLFKIYIYIYIKGAVCDTWVFIITTGDKIRSVTCFPGHLSPILHYALPC